MWQVANRTPFAAAQSWVRNLDGAETWIVAVKATFLIHEDGSLEVSPEQPPPTRAPVYRGEPASSSIEYENDFVLAKTTTDVVVNGTAHAPESNAVSSLDVAFSVGQIAKTVRVVGDRSWNLGGTLLSEPRPFVTMPIMYERAFGGVDPAARPDTGWYWPNPAGTGFLLSDRGIAKSRVPNIEYPNDPYRSWKERPQPAGLGFIGAHWQERARLTGTCDEAWSATRQPLLPVDFDLRHFQGVPQDQQTPRFLLGDEPVALMNLTPSSLLRFRLPTVDLRMMTRFMDGERREHSRPLLHTVIIEPDIPRVSLVWHSAIECHAKVYKLDHTRIEWRNAPDDATHIGSLLDL